MNTPDYYSFPAVFSYAEDGISIEFPDFPGCLPCGKNEAEAFKNAREALGLHLFGMECDNEVIPAPSAINAIHTPHNSAIVLIEVFMPSIRDAALNKAVKKTLTIPAWLNYKAEAANVNFSQLLQDSLKQYLGLSN